MCDVVGFNGFLQSFSMFSLIEDDDNWISCQFKLTAEASLERHGSWLYATA